MCEVLDGENNWIQATVKKVTKKLIVIELYTPQSNIRKEILAWRID